MTRLFCSRFQHNRCVCVRSTISGVLPKKGRTTGGRWQTVVVVCARCHHVCRHVHQCWTDVCGADEVPRYQVMRRSDAHWWSAALDANNIPKNLSKHRICDTAEHRTLLTPDNSACWSNRAGRDSFSLYMYIITAYMMNI